MKASSFRLLLVVTADQVSSRRNPDRVPMALSVLDRVGEWVLDVERTAGDEIQGLTDSPAAVVAAVTALTRLDGWRIGIGLGEVEMPLPPSTRAARGPAYLAAREAVESTHRAPAGLRVMANSTSVTGIDYRDCEAPARRAEAALVMLRTILERRTEEGWQVSDIMAPGMSGKMASEQLGISASAVSQRLSRAEHGAVLMGRELATELLSEALGAFAR